MYWQKIETVQRINWFRISETKRKIYSTSDSSLLLGINSFCKEIFETAFEKLNTFINV